MKRCHSMPFGAECEDDGRVRFRLWAPAARQVELSLAGDSKRTALDRRNNGWFELNTIEAKAGSQYYFRINDEYEVPDPASRFQPQDVHGPSLARTSVGGGRYL
jgi:1,4-alpha-glucan branching enzyme